MNESHNKCTLFDSPEMSSTFLVPCSAGCGTLVDLNHTLEHYGELCARLQIRNQSPDRSPKHAIPAERLFRINTDLEFTKKHIFSQQEKRRNHIPHPIPQQRSPSDGQHFHKVPVVVNSEQEKKRRKPPPPPPETLACTAEEPPGLVITSSINSILNGSKKGRPNGLSGPTSRAPQPAVRRSNLDEAPDSRSRKRSKTGLSINPHRQRSAHNKSTPSSFSEPVMVSSVSSMSESYFSQDPTTNYVPAMEKNTQRSGELMPNPIPAPLDVTEPILLRLRQHMCMRALRAIRNWQDQPNHSNNTSGDNCNGFGEGGTVSDRTATSVEMWKDNNFSFLQNHSTVGTVNAPPSSTSSLLEFHYPHNGAMSTLTCNKSSSTNAFCPPPPCQSSPSTSNQYTSSHSHSMSSGTISSHAGAFEVIRSCFEAVGGVLQASGGQSRPSSHPLPPPSSLLSNSSSCASRPGGIQTPRYTPQENLPSSRVNNTSEGAPQSVKMMCHARPEPQPILQQLMMGVTSGSHLNTGMVVAGSALFPTSAPASVASVASSTFSAPPQPPSVVARVL